MKTLFLVAILMFFGSFVFANDEKFPKEGLIYERNMPEVCSEWVTVHTWCDVTFYLCLDHYNNEDDLLDRELDDDIRYFAGIKCD